MMIDLSPINDFLSCKTPSTWINNAKNNVSILLIDHANCEKKAASSAMNLIYRYHQHMDLLQKMSRLCREEMRHFEQVIAIMQKRDIRYDFLSSSRYAAGLRKHVRTSEPERLVDLLIIGAFIEARSCERFSCLIAHIDEELSQFYSSLLKSESRHFQDYLKLAEKYSPKPIADRLDFFANVEKDLILSADIHFRFHSGVPG